MAIAKNPNLRDFCLFWLEQIGRLTSHDRRFEAFCAGVFSGVLSQSIAVSPRALYHVFPRDRAAWAAFLAANGGAAAPARLAQGSGQPGSPPAAARYAIPCRTLTGVWKWRPRPCASAARHMTPGWAASPDAYT